MLSSMSIYCGRNSFGKQLPFKKPINAGPIKARRALISSKKQGQEAEGKIILRNLNGRRGNCECHVVNCLINDINREVEN